MQREEYSKKYADMHIQNMEIMKYMSKYTKTLKDTKSGLPQGFIVGPVSFYLTINDLF